MLEISFEIKIAERRILKVNILSFDLGWES